MGKEIYLRRPDGTLFTYSESLHKNNPDWTVVTPDGKPDVPPEPEKVNIAPTDIEAVIAQNAQRVDPTPSVVRLVDGPPTDPLRLMTREQLIEYAKINHGMEFKSNTPKDAILKEVMAAKAAEKK